METTSSFLQVLKKVNTPIAGFTFFFSYIIHLIAAVASDLMLFLSQKDICANVLVSNGPDANHPSVSLYLHAYLHYKSVAIFQRSPSPPPPAPPFPSSSPLLSTNYVTLPDLTSAVPPLADINSHLHAGVCKGQFGKGQIQAPENRSVSPPVFECCVLLSLGWMMLMLHLELNMVLKITQNVTAE